MYVGAILMDLSKAFDCIPHDLVLAKLQAYGVSKHSCNLLASYLSHTGQCKRTVGCYNELVVAFFSTGGGLKGKNIYTC